MSDHCGIFYPELQLSLGENLIYGLEEASSLASSFLTISPQSSKKRKMGDMRYENLEIGIRHSIHITLCYDFL